MIIEAAIAFILISVGLIGLLMVSVNGTRATQESFERTEAINLASQIAVKVRTSGNGFLEWNRIDVAKPNTWTTGNASTLTALNELHTITTDRLTNATATVVIVTPGTTTDCIAVPCEVQVDVAWTGASRQPRSYRVSSWIGLQ